MKKTSFIRQINKENKKYKIVKTIAYLQTKLSFGKKRKQKELSYSFFKMIFIFTEAIILSLNSIISNRPI